MDHSIKEGKIQPSQRMRKFIAANCVLILCFNGLLQPGFAAENEPASETEESLPDLEFLEFLGQFETDSGQWIDPGSLMAEEFEGLLNAVENGNATTNDDDEINSDIQ